MKKRILAYLLAMILGTAFAFAQDSLGKKIHYGNEETAIEELRENPKNKIFGINIGFSNPQDDFDKILDNGGFGFGIYGGAHFDPFPAALLFGFNYYNYSYDDEKYYPVDFYMPFELILRFQPSSGKIMPYFEIIGSLGILAGEEIGVDGTSSYGLGAGIMYPLINTYMFAGLDPDGGKHFILAAEIGIRYIRGGDIKSEFDAFLATGSNVSNINQITLSFGICLLLP